MSGDAAGLAVLAVITMIAAAVNSVAGGGTILTFPALAAILPPDPARMVIANATSTIGLWPGAIAAAWAYRGEREGQPPWALWLVLPSVAGALVGSALVLVLPPEWFAALVPWLILLAAVLFAVQPQVTALLAGRGRPVACRTARQWRAPRSNQAASSVVGGGSPVEGGLDGASPGVDAASSVVDAAPSVVGAVPSVVGAASPVVDAASSVVGAASSVVGAASPGVSAASSVVGDGSPVEVRLGAASSVGHATGVPYREPLAHGASAWNLPLACVLQFLVAVYGGYFGAGIGILMLAMLGMLSLGDIHRLNAVKNVLGMVVNGAAAALFAVGSLAGSHDVAWTHAGVMAVASVIGGLGGSHLARRLPARFVRRIVSIIGFVLAAYYFVK